MARSGDLTAVLPAPTWRVWCSEPSRFLLRALGIGFAVGAVLMVDSVRPARSVRQQKRDDKRAWATLTAHLDDVRALLDHGLPEAEVRAALEAQGVIISPSTLREYAACYESVRAPLDAATSRPTDGLAS